MSALAARTGAINLGQGFPDTDGPREMLEAASRGDRRRAQPVPAGAGRPGAARGRGRAPAAVLRAATSTLTREVLVTAGATEAIASVVLALCEPGDEVVTFEPYYDSYAATIALAGGVHRTSVLARSRTSRWTTSLAAGGLLRPTRLVLLNTPHNPTGKVFIAGRARAGRRAGARARRWVVTDEVYEHLRFDGLGTSRSRRCPGWRSGRSPISSAGKTFSRHRVEGRLGDRAGPARVAAARTVKQFLTYVASGPFQPAVALGARAGRRRLCRLWPRSLQAQEGPALRRPSSDAGLPVSRPPRGPTSSSPTPHRSGRPTASRSPCAAGARGVVGGAGLGVPRRPERGTHVGPVRVLQEGRGPGRGQPTAGLDQSSLKAGSVRIVASGGCGPWVRHCPHLPAAWSVVHSLPPPAGRGPAIA